MAFPSNPHHIYDTSALNRHYFGNYDSMVNLICFQDYYAYLTHRLYHFPWLYKRFHKMHHKYTCPTAFSVTAIHPIEMIHMQLGLAAPIVFLPVHWSKILFLS